MGLWFVPCRNISVVILMFWKNTKKHVTVFFASKALARWSHWLWLIQRSDRKKKEPWIQRNGRQFGYSCSQDGRKSRIKPPKRQTTEFLLMPLVFFSVWHPGGWTFAEEFRYNRMVLMSVWGLSHYWKVSRIFSQSLTGLSLTCRILHHPIIGLTLMM